MEKQERELSIERCKQGRFGAGAKAKDKAFLACFCGSGAISLVARETGRLDNEV